MPAKDYFPGSLDNPAGINATRALKIQRIRMGMPIAT